jgi:cell division protein FtsQ
VRRWPSLPRPRRPRRAARPRRVSWLYHVAIVAIVGATLAAGYLFWLRDSSLVAVNDVEVVGVTTEREQIVTELTRAAKEMTTLHVDNGRIESLARSFPTVAAVSVDANFPHGMRIELTERPPALVVRAGSEEVPAAADGTLLRGVEVGQDEGLPVLELRAIPPDGLEGQPLDEALVLGAAPPPLRPLIEKVDDSDEYGIVATLRGGIPVRFGTSEDVAQKWAAAAAVLADPKLEGLTYVDVRVPDRGAAGGASPSPALEQPPA